MKKFTLRGHKNSINLLRSYNDEYFASCSDDGSCRIWSTLTHKPIHCILLSLAYPSFPTVNVFTFSIDGTYIYLASQTSIFVYNLQRAKENGTLLINETERVLCYNADEITMLSVFQKDNRNFLASCDDSGEIVIISLDDYTVHQTLRNGHQNICVGGYYIKSNEPSCNFISGGLDASAILWNIENGNVVKKFDMQTIVTDELSMMVNPPLIHSLCIHPNHTYAFVGKGNGEISVINVRNQSICASIKAHNTWIADLQCYNNSIIVSVGNDQEIKFWQWQINENEQIELTLLYTCKHFRKVNSLLILKERAYIADISADITVITIPPEIQ